MGAFVFSSMVALKGTGLVTGKGLSAAHLRVQSIFNLVIFRLEASAAEVTRETTGKRPHSHTRQTAERGRMRR